MQIRSRVPTASRTLQHILVHVCCNRTAAWTSVAGPLQATLF
jgi:hypothetical protein